MCEFFAARAAVAGHGAHLYHGAVCAALHLYGQEALGWQVVQLNCSVSIAFMLMALRLLYGVDGQDNFANTLVECVLNHLAGSGSFP